MTELAPMADALGWALVHSLWQITLAAIVVATAMRIVPQRNAALRCAISLAGMIGSLVAFLATFLLQLRTGQPVAAVMPVEDALLGAIGQSTTLLGTIWFAGFAVLSLRYAAMLQATGQLRRHGLAEAPAMWRTRFANWAARLGAGSQVALFESNRIKTPLTIGMFKPVVLVPAGFFLRLPADQAEAILIHELAHICRQDYLFGLIQEIARTAFFYHPAIYYLARITDLEREHACDARVVTESGAAAPLAKGLSRIAIDAKHGPIGFAVAAHGGRAPLVQRIRRLGQADAANGSESGVSAFAVTMLFLGAIGITIGADAIAPRGLDAAEPAEAAMQPIAALVPAQAEEAQGPIAAVQAETMMSDADTIPATAAPMAARRTVSPARPSTPGPATGAHSPVAGAQAIAYSRTLPAGPNGGARIQFAAYRVADPAIRYASADDDCPEEQAERAAEKVAAAAERSAAALEREMDRRAALLEREQDRREAALERASDNRERASEQLADRMEALRERIEDNNERLRDAFERRMQRKADRYDSDEIPASPVTISFLVESPAAPMSPALPVVAPAG